MGDPVAVLIAEARAADGPVTVPLGGYLVRIRPVWDWPWDAVTALTNGWYHRWARHTLGGDGAAVWRRLDPTNGQVAAFLAAWGMRGGDDADAIRRLAPILTNHTRALDGDLALRGIDLRDLFRPGGGTSRLTWRHLLAVWEALPGECLTKTALRDELGDEKLAELGAAERKGHGAWTHEALLLAAVIDAVRRLTWRFEQVSFEDGRKIPPPEPLPRPGVVAKRQRKLNAQGLAYLQYLRTNRGAAPPGTTSLGQVGGR